MSEATPKDPPAPRVKEADLAWAVVCPQCSPSWLFRCVHDPDARRLAALHGQKQAGHEAYVVPAA